MDKNTNVKEILNSLTLKEKIRLLNGVGSWYTSDANGKLPKIMMTDGPHGLRKQGEGQTDINDSLPSTCFPTASCVANSWDLEMIKAMANEIAEQALQEEVGIVLGCGMNIKRSPMCGRNFEYYSEDPLLAGSLATAFVDTMQKRNVGTSIKHFACNNQETRRQSSDSIVDERALREIYLRPFEIAVRNAQPTTIMASYNKINGKYTCQNKKIITDILRKEWGFKGALISDWGAAVDMPACVKAGLNLAMPDSGGYQPMQIEKAYKKGEITEEEINKACEKVIELVLRLANNQKIQADYQKAHLTAKKIAENSAVLLKNEGTLPLSKPGKIIILGQMAEDMRIQGGGSSHINATPGDNVIESLKKKGFEVEYAPAYPADDKVETTSQADCKAMADAAVTLAKKGVDENIPVLLFFGLTNRTEGEGFDRHDMNLPSEQLAALKEIIAVNKKAIAVTFGGSPFAIPFFNDVSAILHMALAGEACGEACASLLTGEANPSGKLSETFPYSERDVPSRATWGKAEAAIEYRESIFTGYRYYDTFKVPVQFDFGYGLSYTSFEYSKLKLSSSSFDAAGANEAIGNVGATSGYGDAKADNTLKVQFKLKNTGKVSGAEVVQLYVKNPEGDYLRPSKELRAFTKVFLEAGEEKNVSLELDAKAFSLFDADSGKYLAPAGTYEIQICASLSDVKLSESVNVSGVDYKTNEKANLPSYAVGFSGEPFSHEDFAKLYREELPDDSAPKIGSFTIYNSLAEGALLSKYCKKQLDKIVNGIIEDNKKLGRNENDPAVKIAVCGMTENPIESIILLTACKFKPKFARALVHIVNRKYCAAFKEFLFGR
jgi:beta-glucosidase